MTLYVLDLGGGSVQTAVWDKELQAVSSFKTPATMNEMIDRIAADFEERRQTFEGIAISAPGIVDQERREIRGLSAIPYIHTHSLWDLLEERLGVPVVIENDAKCSGICEMQVGAGKNYQDALFFVIGTGVGGAVFIDGKLHRGRDLSAGEFGMMIGNNGKTLSYNGTVSNMARFYSQETGQQVDGKQLFEAMYAGDEVAESYITRMFEALAQKIFELQVALDVEVVIISGGISVRSDLIEQLAPYVDRFFKEREVELLRPEIKVAHYANSSNLIGAALNFLEQQAH